MKKILFITFACILALQTPVYADVVGSYLPAVFQEAKENGYVDLETRPLILTLGENSRVVESFIAVGTHFVPLRETAVFFGKTTVYDAASRTVRLLDTPPVSEASTAAKRFFTGEAAETKRFFTSDLPVFYGDTLLENPHTHPLLINAYMREGTLYVPLRAIAEAFDYMYLIEYETDTIHLQQPAGMVTPVRISEAFCDEERQFRKQLTFLQEGDALYQNAALQPYLAEITLIENYAYNEPNRVTRGWLDKNDDALVLYEGEPYIYFVTHTIEWQNCTGPAFATLYRLNLPDSSTLS